MSNCSKYLLLRRHKFVHDVNHQQQHGSVNGGNINFSRLYLFRHSNIESNWGDLVMNWNSENLLEVVEMYANEQGWIASEEELSEAFDRMIEECRDIETKYKLKNDAVMLLEEFSNYADGLCKAGDIHSVQYEEYEYIGEIEVI